MGSGRNTPRREQTTEMTSDLIEAVVTEVWLKAKDMEFQPPLETRATDSNGKEILYMLWDVDIHGLPLRREVDDEYVSEVAAFPLFVTITDSEGRSLSQRVEACQGQKPH